MGLMGIRTDIMIDLALVSVLIFSIFGPYVMDQKYISVGLHVIFDDIEYPCNIKDDGCKFFIKEDTPSIYNILPTGISFYWIFFTLGLIYCLIQSKNGFAAVRNQIRKYCIVLIILNIIFHLTGLTVIYMYSKRLYELLSIPGSHTLYLGFSTLLFSFISPLYKVLFM